MTLHHFTHPAWLGRTSGCAPTPSGASGTGPRWSPTPWPARFATGSPSTSSMCWPSTRGSSGMFPPGRSLAFEDAAIAADHLLAAHVAGYDVIHAARPDAVVTTNNGSVERLRVRPDAHRPPAGPGAGVARGDLDAWIADRRRQPRRAPPRQECGRAGLSVGPRRRVPPTADPVAAPPTRGTRARPPLPRQAVDALYGSPHERALDVLSLDYYDPEVARHFRMPGHRTPGGRSTTPPASCGTT